MKASLQPEISDLQERTAQAIANIFETGRAHGDYGKVTLLAGDRGHLTYGRSQTTQRARKFLPRPPAPPDRFT
ncbi:MAG: hypothetical protein HY646_08615 [Acidobacteria bacterium]|nr:hypothetical protein [Acidobacteriota bacterium]